RTCASCCPRRFARPWADALSTLVVSDLHLSWDRSVLREPAAREALAEAIGRGHPVGAVARADRLVLLGDVVELRQRPAPRALDGARQTLELIGSALDPGRPLL